MNLPLPTIFLLGSRTVAAQTSTPPPFLILLASSGLHFDIPSRMKLSTREPSLHTFVHALPCMVAKLPKSNVLSAALGTDLAPDSTAASSQPSTRPVSPRQAAPRGAWGEAKGSAGGVGEDSVKQFPGKSRQDPRRCTLHTPVRGIHLKGRCEWVMQFAGFFANTKM